MPAKLGAVWGYWFVDFFFSSFLIFNFLFIFSSSMSSLLGEWVFLFLFIIIFVFFIFTTTWEYVKRDGVSHPFFFRLGGALL